jgi:hypothetical protein
MDGRRMKQNYSVTCVGLALDAVTHMNECCKKVLKKEWNEVKAGN